MIPAHLVVTEARRWLGTPYRHQGRGPDSFDCAGLIVRVCEDLGLLRTRLPANYARMSSDQLGTLVGSYCLEVDTATEGTLILVRWPGDPEPAHTAICTGDNLIHCYRIAGKVVEHGFRAPWDRLAHSVWQLPGVRY